MEVNNFELYLVEKIQTFSSGERISPNFPSALASSCLSRWPTLIRQTVTTQRATFSFPHRLSRLGEGVTLNTDLVLLVRPALLAREFVFKPEWHALCLCSSNTQHSFTDLLLAIVVT